MKEYLFGAYNWKSDTSRAFFVRKKFSSAYYADRWAMRLSFHTKNSPYMIWLIAGKEVEA